MVTFQEFKEHLKANQATIRRVRIKRIDKKHLQVNWQEKITYNRNHIAYYWNDHCLILTL